MNKKPRTAATSLGLTILLTVLEIYLALPQKSGALSGSALPPDVRRRLCHAVRVLLIKGDKAFIKQRPATSLPMQPLYKDHFLVQGFVVWFTHKNGKVNGLHVSKLRSGFRTD